MSFWCGRFMALSDKDRNNSFKAELELFDTTSRVNNADQCEGDSVRRARRVFEALMALCVNDEARDSLMVSCSSPELSFILPTPQRLFDCSLYTMEEPSTDCFFFRASKPSTPAKMEWPN